MTQEEQSLKKYLRSSLYCQPRNTVDSLFLVDVCFSEFKINEIID